MKIPSLFISTHGRFGIEPQAQEEGVNPFSSTTAAKIEKAFAQGVPSGLLHLATAELKTPLPPSFAFARDFARRYLTQLCHEATAEPAAGLEPVAPPPDEEFATLALGAPPMKGIEYLDAAALRRAWISLDEHVRAEAAHWPGGAHAYLHDKNPSWRAVGRVTFHLAENKRDEEHPFAFLATYAARLSDRGEPQHLPLARALKEYAGAANRKQLVALLTPIEEAARRLSWVQTLVDSGELYQASAWSPAEAHRLLRDAPALEESGLMVRIPDWWKADKRPRPQVSVRIGEKRKSTLGADALLDFSVATTLNGEALTEREWRELLSSGGGLVRLRGQWVEAEPEKLKAALEHWKRVVRENRTGGVSFFEGMRMLAGVSAVTGTSIDAAVSLREWSGIEPGGALRELLDRLRDPSSADEGKSVALRELRASLRPYQQTGVQWLRLLTGLRLGACLADDMGLGKTIQVIALLLHLKKERSATSPPSLVVAPASLISNWKAELERFAPSLSCRIAHPSENAFDPDDEPALERLLAGCDVAVTTYGVTTRTEALRRRCWRLVILDEAQAIKNPGTQQTRAIKQLQADARIALTGTPIENRVSDLWSLFDFLNPGLLGDTKAFSGVVKRLSGDHGASWAPLRKLVQPYILRRLKTDRRVIDDLPEKTEVRAYCGLSREQVALYTRCVRELAQKLEQTEGIQRRGTVLGYLMQLKQICNHPAQWQGGAGDWKAERSGKLERLGALCAELAERQEKVLVFTQFREIADPLAEYLSGVFGRSGLVLHGGTAVTKRREMVEAFQREEGPPFFVLSLKAGGTGLNLTAASQVIHFDRWWNPAVENQATDRAFRIGQKRNVLVHKFVCRGTVEEKIDSMIEEKTGLAQELLGEGGEKLLTELSDRELLDMVALDIHKACDS